jgi:YNFM family putative membrane transporter
MLFVLMVATPLYAPLVRRFEKKKMMMVSLFFLFWAVLLSAYATSYEVLLFSRVLQGVFIPGITAIMLAYVQEIYPQKHRGLGMGVYMAATGFGAVMGRLLAGWMTYVYSYKEAFGVFALLLLLALGAMAWGLPSVKVAEPHAKKGIQKDNLFRYLTQAKIVSILLIPMVVFFSFMAMTTFVTYYLAQAPFLLDERQLGNLFLILLLAIVVSPLTGKYSDKVGRVKMLFLALTILLIGMLLTLTQSLWLIIIGLGLVTIGMFSVQSVAPTYLGDLVPSDRATLAVAYQSFFYMGGALGTLVPAWAWRYAGFSGVVWLCVGLVVLGSLGFWYNTIKNQRTKI